MEDLGTAPPAVALAPGIIGAMLLLIDSVVGAPR